MSLSFTPMRIHALTFSLLIAFLPALPRQAAAQKTFEFQYTTGHADVRSGSYDPETKSFRPGWHFDSGIAPKTVYDAEDAIAIVTKTQAAPSGAMTALGVTNGTLIYIAGSSSAQPNLGFSGEDLNASDWEPVDFGGIFLPSVTATLTSWSGPGEFALYTTNKSGTTLIDLIYSSVSPSETLFNNGLELAIPDHQHFTWGFTEEGYYELEITWSGIHQTDGPISTSAIYAFNVGGPYVIPEPSTVTLALIGLAGLGHAAFRRRRKPLT